MILTTHTRVVFTYTIFRNLDDRPHPGDVFRDPRGNTWTIQHVMMWPVIGGPSNMTPWSIDIAAEHGAYLIEPGELMPVHTMASGVGWSGNIEHEGGIGFGNVVQRLPGPELTYGDTQWSWFYRELPEEWLFQVGPYVSDYHDFHDPLFEIRGQKLDNPQWNRVRECIHRFQEGAD
jgi:hypothetical protein